MGFGYVCTDPFETGYIHGFDSRRVMEAGVDCITANILPTSVGLNAKGRPYYFHRMQLQLPMVSAQVADHSIISMLNVQDASEEWSVLEHRPTQLERDLYTITSYRSGQGNTCTDAAEGLMICLGDGIDPYHWKFLKSRMDVGFDVKASRSWSPMLLWSDHAHEAMLPAYLETRRTTVHKQGFEVFKAGTPFGGCLRTDRMAGFEGILFVPNFDLLSEAEQRALAQSAIPFVATAPKSYDLSDLKITHRFEDFFSDFPLCAVVCNGMLSEQALQEIERLCGEDDGTVSRADAAELTVSALFDEIPFCKLTGGFIKAIGAALRGLMQAQFPVTCSKPMMALRLENGKDRLYLYNDDEDHYDHALVACETELRSVQVVSHFPVLPPRFVRHRETSYSFDYNAAASANQVQIKLQPAGVTVVDIER